MNIAQAMEHIKKGSICKIHGIYVKYVRYMESMLN